MSGPIAETSDLFTRVPALTAIWPLEMWTVNGEAHLECGRCDDGTLLVAGDRSRRFTLAELAAIIERHSASCPGTADA